MEIQGKIIAVLQERTGQNSRGAWKAQEYVLETHDQHPKRVVFTVFGAERIDRFNIKMGQEIMAAIDIDASEYQGRWYNSIRAYDVRLREVATTNNQPQAPKKGAAENDDDNLPF